MQIKYTVYSVWKHAREKCACFFEWGGISKHPQNQSGTSLMSNHLNAKILFRGMEYMTYNTVRQCSVYDIKYGVHNSAM